MAVLGSPSLTVLMVSVDVKQHFNFLSKPYGLCGRKATLNLFATELCESGDSRTATLNSNSVTTWPLFSPTSPLISWIQNIFLFPSPSLPPSLSLLPPLPPPPNHHLSSIFLMSPRPVSLARHSPDLVTR